MTASKILLVGNCQAPGIAQCLGLLLPHRTIEGHSWLTYQQSTPDLSGLFDGVEEVITHRQFRTEMHSRAEAARWSGRISTIPAIYFAGLHPDAVHARVDQRKVGQFTGGLTSAIALYSWLHGIAEADCLKLFDPEVFQHIGYFSYWEKSQSHLREHGRDTSLPIDGLIEKWAAQKQFMHILNHPKLFVLADLARAIARMLGETPHAVRPEDVLTDELLSNAVWPIYPGVAENIGLDEGNYAFKTASSADGANDFRIVDLEEYVSRSYLAYRRQVSDRSKLDCVRFDDPIFQRLRDHFANTPRPRGNPYDGLPEHQFWRSGVASVEKSDLDPVVTAKFEIAPGSRIATAGSCFAQHIGPAVARNGGNFFVAEPGPQDRSADENRAANYGLFSARYGNMYTPRQLLQTFRMAFDQGVPLTEPAWRTPEGRYLDPYRPSVEPGGFESEDAMLADRQAHLRAVREMFEQLDVFVFTLGLTEAWQSVNDGSVFPTAPGAVDPTLDNSNYQFANYTLAHTVKALDKFLYELTSINRKARVILTVSPVPLVATFEQRHVLVSTTYSKSVLRVAADEVSQRNLNVAYFPSYEIITGQHAGNSYLHDNLRTVQQAGVDHVMRTFLRHYLEPEGASGVADDAGTGPASKRDAVLRREFDEGVDMLCDEELLDAALKTPGRAAPAEA